MTHVVIERTVYKVECLPCANHVKPYFAFIIQFMVALSPDRFPEFRLTEPGKFGDSGASSDLVYRFVGIFIRTGQFVGGFGKIKQYIPITDHLPVKTGARGFQMSLFVEQFVRVVLVRSEEHTSELQSRENLVCRLLLENKKGASASECS